MNSFLRKVTSAVSTVAIAASAVGSIATVSAASEFLGYADALANAGYITKTNEAGYRLSANITRAEMAKIAVKVAGKTAATCTAQFSDVSSKLGDLCGYIVAAANAGIVSSSSKTFRPTALLTRAEMVKMLMVAKGVAVSSVDAGFTDLKGLATDLVGYINAAADAGYIAAGLYFNPKNNATRGEVFKVAANVAGLTTDDSDLGLNDLGDLFGTGTVGTGSVVSTGSLVITNTGVTAAGDLTVSLNPVSPANGSQVASTGIVRFAVVDFKSASSDVALNTVELKKAGLASIPSGTKVWFEKAGTRLSGKASFTSENNAVISFAPAYVVKAGTVESLELYVELAGASIGNDMQFVSAAIVSSAKNTTGSFLTPSLRVTNYAVASSTFTANTSAAQTYNASNDAVELAKFTIANTDTNSDTRDLKFQSIVLYQSGTANLTNLSNITVEKNGVVVSSSAAVSGKMLTLTVADTIKDGASAIYIVKAKINNVELTTDTYQFYLKNASDVNLIEADSAFRSNLSIVTANASIYSVNGGDVKFERDTTSALSQTVAPGTSDVTLMKGTITAKSAVTLEDVSLTLTTSTGAATSLNTVYLQIGSSTFTATPSSTTGALDFFGTATINGTAPVRAYVKLKDGATGTIKLSSLAIGSFKRKEYAINQNTVASAIGSIDGVNITVGNSTLNVSRTDGLGATKLASGTKGVLVYKASFSSTQGNPIALSNFSAVTTGTANSYTGGNTSLTLYVDGVAKSTKNINTTTVNFDGLNATVSTTKSVEVMIKADFSDVTTSGTFQIASISYDAVDNLTSVNLSSKPTVAGAVFTIDTAAGTLAATTGDALINRTLLLAGSVNQKLTSFKVTASNDNIKVKTITLTGTNLDALSNIRLTDSVGTVLGVASDVTATGATFANLDNSAASAILIDKSATYYVVADVNSSTNVTGVSANVVLTNSKIVGTNGSEQSMAGAVVAGSAHDVSENTFKVTQVTPSSKALATDALEFTVNAYGKNNVTLSGITLTSVVSGYDTGSIVINVVRKSDNAVVGTGAFAASSTITLNNANSIDYNSSATYIIKYVGAVVTSGSNSQDWTVSVTSLTTTSGLDAANYPKNTDTLPLTSNK